MYVVDMASRFTWRESAKPSEDMGNGDVPQDNMLWWLQDSGSKQVHIKPQW